jgi:hypothetical protein
MEIILIVQQDTKEGEKIKGSRNNNYKMLWIGWTEKKFGVVPD